jgi:low affinity Fe/Cu permease
MGSAAPRHVFCSLAKEAFMNGFFHKFAQGTAALIGSHWAFVVAFAGCLLWALMGPVFDYSSTWQLVINTATTVLTFLAVFLIQNTQNRSDLAVQLKLDELLRAIETARTGLIDLEDATDEEIETLRREFQRLHERGAANVRP